MEKKFIVRLNDSERKQLNTVIKKLDGSGQKVQTGQMRKFQKHFLAEQRQLKIYVNDSLPKVLKTL